MEKDEQLGLDELMIVNPSSSCAEAMFLGEDGTLYAVQGLGETTQQGMRQYFLSGDGSLYHVQGVEAGSSAERGNTRYFLGEDGVLYEVAR